MNRPAWLGLAAAAAIVLLDQATKLAVLAIMNPPRVIPIVPTLDLILTWNRGVSFSMFREHDLSPLVFVGVAAAIVVALLFWLRKAETRLTAAAIGLVIGGAVGNVIDRLAHGAVVDFIYFHVGSFQWPAFNVADSAITVGVVLLLADSLFPGREKAR